MEMSVPRQLGLKGLRSYVLIFYEMKSPFKFNLRKHPDIQLHPRNEQMTSCKFQT